MAALPGLAPNQTIADLMAEVSKTATKKVDEMMIEGLDLFKRGYESDSQGPLREKHNYSRDATGNLVYTWGDDEKTTVDLNKKWSDMNDREQVITRGYIDAPTNPDHNNQVANVASGLRCLSLPENATRYDNCVYPEGGRYFMNALRDSLILKKLGFKTLEKNTTLGKLKVVESVDSWLQRNKVEKDNSNDILGGRDTILILNKFNTTGNTIGSAALARLREMVGIVNRTPSILNKGWKAPKDSIEYKSPKADVPTPTDKKEPVFTWMTGGSNVDGEVEAINNVIKSDSHAIKLASGLKELQHGGGSEYRLSLDKFDDKTVFALQSAYNDLKSKLEAKGKSLDKADQDLIENELTSYNKLHRKVLLSVEIMRAVNDMVSKGLITKDKIPVNDVIDKQHLLVKKSEDKKRKLMVILGSLGSAVAVEVGHKAAPTAPPSVPTEIPVSLEDLVIE